MGAARATGEAAGLVMRALAGEGAALGTPELAAATGLGLRQVSQGCRQLARRGWAAKHLRSYRLTEAGRAALASGASVTSGPVAPTGARRRVADTFRVRAWRSMRIRRAFSAAEVAMDAARDEADPVEDAHRYLLQLGRAGYVAPLGAHTRSVPPAQRRWRLVRDSGPLAPVWSRAKGEMQDDNVRAEGRDGRS
jgi:DNA-binding IclR family transcriptional regulator